MKNIPLLARNIFRQINFSNFLSRNVAYTKFLRETIWEKMSVISMHAILRKKSRNFQIVRIGLHFFFYFFFFKLVNSLLQINLYTNSDHRLHFKVTLVSLIALYLVSKIAKSKIFHLLTFLIQNSPAQLYLIPNN